MGTQTPPETETENQPSPDNQSVSSEPEATGTSTPPVTPQTTQPTAPPIRAEYVEALQAQLREQNRQIQELQNAANRPVNMQQQQQSEPLGDRNAFFNDPHGETRKVIAAELDRVAAPLNQALQQLARGNNSDSLKNRFKYSPMYQEYFKDRNFEAAVDLVMSRVDPTEGNYQAAVNQAIGWYHTGQLSQVLGYNVPVPQPPTPPSSGQTVPNQPAPPYTPPTPPRTPRPNDAPRQRQLTENERRIARENNMTEAQYLEWLNEPAANVVGSKIGRTP